MRFLLLAFALCLISAAAQASETGCTLIVHAETGATLHNAGNCHTRLGAQSTFKIPLAVMGFDSGILKDAHNPVWQYEKGFTRNRPEDEQPTDPTYWEKESVVWFSQKLTRQLGMEKFSRYVETFDYGNKDLTGNPGRNDGLTNAWLSSSLQISPVEQIAFIRKLRQCDLGVSQDACDKTTSVMPVYELGEWVVRGKTGTGFPRNADGTKNRKRQEGWFVGWASKGGDEVLFAKTMTFDSDGTLFAGLKTRDAFLKELPALAAQQEQ